MMAELLINSKTRDSIEKFADKPSSAILITGQRGSGKTAVAKLMASRVLGVEIAKLSTYPYFIHLKKPEDKQEIPIESVRQIIKELQLKPVIDRAGEAKRAILIEDAGSLSDEAQNALLKTIEEPGEDTVFILTAESENRVLPTIASRSQRLTIGPVSSKEAVSYFRGRYPDNLIESVWQLSQGSAALLSALLKEDASHPLKIAVDDAKLFIKKDRYDRLLYLEKLINDKPKLIEFLTALSRVLAALHSSAIKTGNNKQLKKLTTARKQVNNALETMSSNTSPRLICINLSLNLPI